MSKEAEQAFMGPAREWVPASEAELAEVMREAREPLRIEGGGTRWVGAVEGRVLSTRDLAGVTLYEPGALTLVARAGTPLAEVEEVLARERQRLPFEPPDLRALLGTEGRSTIGGVVAANASGPRRIQAGAARDLLIGVRFVDGTGTVVKNGGRVMKNVTGYDLAKLMAGSRGTLGVLTEVAFKLLPAPSAAATLTLSGLDVSTAVRAMAAALGSPCEVSGAAHDPEGGTHLRLEGLALSVAHRAEKLKETLAPFGAVAIERDPEAVAALWRGIRDVAPLAEATGDVWLISVKPTDAPEVAGRLKDARLLFDWGGGRIWAAVPPGQDARAALSGVGGHATLMRATPPDRQRLGTFHPEPEPLARLSRGLRERFDPRGILNPGLMD